MIQFPTFIIGSWHILNYLIVPEKIVLTPFGEIKELTKYLEVVI